MRQYHRQFRGYTSLTEVSADMAYSNRKEYIESIKNPNRDEPYEIFLKELNEITFAQEKKKQNYFQKNLIKEDTNLLF